MSNILQSSILLFLVYFTAIHCGVTVLLERAQLVELDKEYGENASVSVSKISRRSPYYFFFEVTTKQYLTNNVTMTVLLNEFLHNEYKRSFVEYSYRLCDLIEKDKLIGAELRRNNFHCPIAPQRLRLENISAKFMEDFPNILPFEKARVDIDITLTNSKRRIALIYIYATFKQMSTKKRILEYIKPKIELN